MNVRGTQIGVLATVLLSALPAWGDGSCLVPKSASTLLTGGGKLSAIDDRLSVLRPCRGKVRDGADGVLEVLFRTSVGNSGRIQVRSGEAIHDQVSAAMGPGAELTDIWPERSILSALSKWLAGKPSPVAGVAGFDTPPDAPGMEGDLVPMPELTLPLWMFGWTTDAPVRVSQKGWSATLRPRQGMLALPMNQVVEGEMRLQQETGARTVLSVVSRERAGAVQKELSAIDQLSMDRPQKALLRAAVLQEWGYQVNAIAEFVKGQ